MQTLAAITVTPREPAGEESRCSWEGDLACSRSGPSTEAVLLVSWLAVFHSTNVQEPWPCARCQGAIQGQQPPSPNLLGDHSQEGCASMSPSALVVLRKDGAVLRVHVPATEPSASTWAHSARISRRTGPPLLSWALLCGQKPPGLSEGAHTQFSWLSKGVDEGGSAWAPVLTLAPIPQPLSPGVLPSHRKPRVSLLPGLAFSPGEGEDFCSSLLPSDTHFHLPRQCGQGEGYVHCPPKGPFQHSGLAARPRPRQRGMRARRSSVFI